MKKSLRNTYSKIFRYDQSVKSKMKYDPGTSSFKFRSDPENHLPNSRSIKREMTHLVSKSVSQPVISIHTTPVYRIIFKYFVGNSFEIKF